MSYARALRERLPEVTKLIIAQRINSVIDADKIVVLDDGKIVGCGSHDELLEMDGRYADLYHEIAELS